MSDKINTKFRNPMMDMQVASDEEESSAPASVVSNPALGDGDKPPLTEAELYDLGFAFEACDMDESGAIEDSELQAVLAVFGAEISAEKIRALSKKAKKGAATCPKLQAKMHEKNRKNKKGEVRDIDEVHEVDLNLTEFVYLMTEMDEVDEYFPNGWMEGAYHMRLLKSVFQTADLDGNNELESDEFATAINSLHTGNLTETDKALMWDVMNPKGQPFLTFEEFLSGMVAVQNHDELNKKFHLFTPDTLMSLVLDTPVSRKEEAELLANFTAMEALGMTVLEKQAKEMSPDDKTELLKKAQDRTIHKVTDTQRKNLMALHKWNVWECFAAGLASAAVSAAAENVMTFRLHSNGVENPDRCNWFPDVCYDPEVELVEGYDPHDPTNWQNTTKCGGCGEFQDMCDEDGVYRYMNDMTGSELELAEGKCEMSPQAIIIQFWTVVGIVLGICCCAEIVAMYWYSIKNAVRVANVMDLRLKPLNRDRAFVGGSLVRAALELGNTQGVVFGTDPLREQSSKTALIQAILALLYVLKIALSGFLIKVLIKRVMTRGSAKFALPWAAVPATAVWNGFVGHIIMRQAKLRGVGVAMAIELYSIIADMSMVEISDLGKLQMCRAVACNIVKQRDMFPTKEILLKHAVANMGLIRNGLVDVDSSGIVDDADTFVVKIADLNKTETEMVILVTMLCTVLDGRVRKREMQLLADLMEGCSYSDDYTLNPTHVKYLAQRTRNDYPLTIKIMRDVMRANPETKLPGMYYCNECMACCTGCLAC